MNVSILQYFHRDSIVGAKLLGRYQLMRLHFKTAEDAEKYCLSINEQYAKYPYHIIYSFNDDQTYTEYDLTEIYEKYGSPETDYLQSGDYQLNRHNVLYTFHKVRMANPGTYIVPFVDYHPKETDMAWLILGFAGEPDVIPWFHVINNPDDAVLFETVGLQLIPPYGTNSFIDKRIC